jgi:hypothetical protein
LPFLLLLAAEGDARDLQVRQAIRGRAYKQTWKSAPKGADNEKGRSTAGQQWIARWPEGTLEANAQAIKPPAAGANATDENLDRPHINRLRAVLASSRIRRLISASTRYEGRTRKADGRARDLPAALSPIPHCTSQRAANEFLEQPVHLEQQAETNALLSTNEGILTTQQRGRKLQQVMVGGVRPIQHDSTQSQLFDRQPAHVCQGEFKFIEPPLILQGAGDQTQARDRRFRI